MRLKVPLRPCVCDTDGGEDGERTRGQRHSGTSTLAWHGTSMNSAVVFMFVAQNAGRGHKFVYPASFL